jgi:hypothetical protein
VKVFTGERTEFGCDVWVHEGRNVSALDPATHIRNHSPTGFEWGYGGSGPAQLALALCFNVTQDAERAQRVYQQFKWAVVGHLHQSTWTMTEEFIMLWIVKIEAARSS